MTNILVSVIRLTSSCHVKRRIRVNIEENNSPRKYLVIHFYKFHDIWCFYLENSGWLNQMLHHNMFWYLLALQHIIKEIDFGFLVLLEIMEVKEADAIYWWTRHPWKWMDIKEFGTLKMELGICFASAHSTCIYTNSVLIFQVLIDFASSK